MRFFLILNIVAFAIGATVAHDIDLTEALIKANKEIKSNMMDQMMAGAKTSRMNHKKFTVV